MTVTLDSVQPGTRVVGSDGALVGRVEQVEPTHVVVERDAMGEPMVYVPADAVAGIDEERHAVRLGIPADEVDERGWSDPPR